MKKLLLFLLFSVLFFPCFSQIALPKGFKVCDVEKDYGSQPDFYCLGMYRFHAVAICSHGCEETAGQIKNDLLSDKDDVHCMIENGLFFRFDYVKALKMYYFHIEIPKENIDLSVSSPVNDEKLSGYFNWLLTKVRDAKKKNLGLYFVVSK